MKLKTKAIWTLIVLWIAGLLKFLLTPAVALMSNVTTVDQLSNSDQASLAVTYFGNGSGLVSAILAIFTVLFLVLIWTRKTVKPVTKPSE